MAVPAVPHRNPFFDPKDGKATPQFQAFMNVVQMAWPWVKWFQKVRTDTNAANDIALLAASIDENARGGEAQRSEQEALLGVAQAGERAALPSELQALLSEIRAERPIPSELIAMLMERSERQRVDELAGLSLSGTPRSALFDELFAAMLSDNSRFDFRAFAIEGLHADRTTNQKYPAPAYEIGQLFYETDTGLTYVAMQSGSTKVWQYVAGMYSRTQAQLAAFAATLGTTDAGTLVNVSDYVHTLRWSGTAWAFAPGDIGGAFIQGFEEAPTNPTAWVACAGQGAGTVNFLKSDGTLGTNANALPAAAAGYVKFAAAYNAARAATVTQNAATGITINAHTTAADTTVTGAGTRLTGPTNHTLTDPQHQHGLVGADLAGVDLIPYFRV